MSKIRKLFSILRSLPFTIYFNFHYLPFCQAVKLPIILYKPKLLKMNGTVEIIGRVRSNMVSLGHLGVPLYPNDGILWENYGKITFNGACCIGNNSKICVGPSGHLNFGDGFRASAALKCVCYKDVTFDKDVLVGWDCLCSDTDFHTLHFEGQKTKGLGSIHIGRNNWIAMQSLILKGAKTPAYCTLAARTMLNKDLIGEGERILLAGQPAKVVTRDIYHDRYDDSIDYTTL